jgi:hypothetical protein
MVADTFHAQDGEQQALDDDEVAGCISSRVNSGDSAQIVAPTSRAWSASLSCSRPKVVALDGQDGGAIEPLPPKI